MFDINSNLIFLTVSGSQSYGLATETSDLDVKGITLVPRHIRNSLFQKFDQTENYKDLSVFFRQKEKDIITNCGKQAESIIYSLAKYFQLAANCNPNIIELLWVSPEDILFKNSLFDKILENRELFLSKRIRYTFLGYSFSQVKRIVSHRKWLLNPPTKRPERKDYELPEVPTPQYNIAENLIKHEIDHWDFHDLDVPKDILTELKNKVVEKLTYSSLDSSLYDEENIRRGAMKKIGFDDNLMILLEKEYIYRKDLSNYKKYEDWKKTRNPARAALEAKYMYDTKHAAHVVRLTRMGKEILEGKGILVKRPDREELLHIRNGGWTYEQLMEYANNMEKEMEEVYRKSTLPHTVNYEKIDALYQEIIEEYDDKKSMATKI